MEPFFTFIATNHEAIIMWGLTNTPKTEKIKSEMNLVSETKGKVECAILTDVDPIGLWSELAFLRCV